MCNSIDCQLADMERKCGIPQRWARTDQEYMDTKRATIAEKFKQLQGCLWASVVKRYYLLQMKARYAGMTGQITDTAVNIIMGADGQKIAKKLAASIAKEINRVKTFLAEYQTACHQLDQNSPIIPLSGIYHVFILTCVATCTFMHSRNTVSKFQLLDVNITSR